MAVIQERTYSSSILYGWKHISEEQFKRTRKIIDGLTDKMVSASLPEAAYYLVDGCVVRTQQALDSTFDGGWNFKLYAETKKRLEKIAKRLELPL